MSKFDRPIAYLSSCIVELENRLDDEPRAEMRTLILAEKAEHESAIAVLDREEKAKSGLPDGHPDAVPGWLGEKEKPVHIGLGIYGRPALHNNPNPDKEKA